MEGGYHVRCLGLMLGLCFVVLGVDGEKWNRFPILMPNVNVDKPETYLCTPIRVHPRHEYYITGFEPNATMDTAHHMLMFGCTEPGSNEKVWNCGEMATKQEGIPTAPTCKTGHQIVYAWARNAKKLILPKGVAFKVGGESDIQYLVLQVHYASIEKFKNGATDDSGVFVYYTENPQPKTAGVLLLGTGGRILGNSVEYMETACTLKENKVVHPFAFRTHTHSLGRVVAGYKVIQDGPFDQWTLIGKKDPQLPQMFYPVENAVNLTKGDTVAARCTMQSHRNRVTMVGPTNDDEMCNFYIMYWTKGTALTQKQCFTAGPPFYSWERDHKVSRNIPDGASTLPVGETAKEQGYSEAAFK